MKTRSKHVSKLLLHHAANEHPASCTSRSPHQTSSYQHPLCPTDARRSLDTSVGLTRSISPEQRSIVFIVRVRIARGCAAAESRA